MPRSALDDLVTDRLEEARGRGDRFVSMRVDLVLCEVDRTGTKTAWGPIREVLFTAGGKWDRKLGEYVSPAADIDESIVLRCHDGQAEVARFFAKWLSAYLAGRKLRDNRGEAIHEVLEESGRRAGKTDLCVGKEPVLWAVAIPNSIVWVVVPDMTETEEVHLAIQTHLPAEWYQFVKDDQIYQLVNGSKIIIRSSYDPEDLKQGRADFVVVNEAQKQPQEAWSYLAPAIADRGGLLVMTANPPTKASGAWLYDYREKLLAGSMPGSISHHLDNRKNPWVDQEALDQQRRKLSAVDKRTAEIEMDGKWLPPPDVAWHAFSLEHNLVPLPSASPVTAEVLRRRAGFAADYLVGADFQATPHMAGAVWRVYRDENPEADWPHEHLLIYLVHAFRVENADEDQLIDAFERSGFDGKNSLAIGDASGRYQTGAHDVKGKGSFDVFRRRGWRILPPDPKMLRNPLIEERFSVGNALWCSSTGKRRAFIARCPETEAALETVRKHEMRNGRPSKHSLFAHLSDGISYPMWWLFPRLPASKGKIDIVRTERGRREVGVGPGGARVGDPWSEEDD